MKRPADAVRTSRPLALRLYAFSPLDEVAPSITLAMKKARDCSRAFVRAATNRAAYFSFFSMM